MVEYAGMQTAESQKPRAPRFQSSVLSCGASAGLMCALVLVLFGATSSTISAAQAPPANRPAANLPQPENDPVSELIALSTAHFEAGQRELREGHLEMAKAEFNKSLEVLLESRYGARTVP